MALRPILARTPSINDTVEIRYNCGADKVCTPDLRLTSTLDVVEYLLGSDKRIELNVTVENTNEDAFKATYYLMLPRGVDYIKIEQIDKSEIPVQCSLPKVSNNNTLKCDIGNPLPNGNIVKFTVFLQPVSVYDEERSSYEFSMVVNSSDSEDLSTMRDNTQIISMKIRVNTNLLIEGESKPTDIFYNHDNYTAINITSEVEYGPAFTHNYTIHNRGPSRIEAADIFLIWPARTLANDEFLYLIKNPETSANVDCEGANANHWGLKLEQKNHAWHNYDTHGPHEKQPKVPTAPTVTNRVGTKGQSTADVTVGSGGSFISSGSIQGVNSGANGEVPIFNDDCHIKGKIIHPANITRSKQEQETKSKDFFYGSEKNYNSGSSISHGMERESVLSTGISTEQTISGDREETVGGSDFYFGVRNVKSSQDLEAVLNSWATAMVGDNRVFNRGGNKYIQFSGRYRVTSDGREYIETKKGSRFSLENQIGDQSYAVRENTRPDPPFETIEGEMIIAEDGKGYIQLSDGRRIALEGTSSHTKGHSYKLEDANSWQAGSSTSADYSHPTTGDANRNGYNQSRSEESVYFNRQFESDSTRTHEEKQFYSIKKANYERTFRRRREGDTITVEDFRKYEKQLHKLDKRDADDQYDDNDVRAREPIGGEQVDFAHPLCKNNRCVQLRCFVGRLKKDEEVWISARYRVNAATLKKVALYEDLKFSTRLIFNVTKLPNVGEPTRAIIKSHEIFTNLQPKAPAPAPDVVPLWIVALSACAGVMILLLFIFLLHKVCFNRIHLLILFGRTVSSINLKFYKSYILI